MSGQHRKPTASAKKVAKIPVTGSGSRHTNHAGSSDRSAGARSAMPVQAQYIVRAGVLAVMLGVGATVANTPAVAFAEPTDTSSSSSSSDSSRSSSDSSSSDSSSSSVRRRIRRRRLIRRRRIRLVRRLIRCRLRVRHRTARRVRHQRARHRQRIHRIHRLALPQVRSLGLCRGRAARTPALHRRAATPPHQPGRRPPKPGCPLPPPRL